MEKFYDCKQVAAHYGVKIKTVWDWIRAGKLKAVRVGKQYRIPKEALAEFEKSK
ncbi:MAG: helix-turn-helix domain-containing protein [Alistipes sp.]|nr:helix-turn-helix domain-containing protein [Alistipes sp.]